MLTGIDLHAALSYHEINAIKNQVKFEHYSGRIEATHFAEGMPFMTLSGLVGSRSSVNTLEPQLQMLGDDPQFQAPAHEIYLLDSEADDLLKKLETYVKTTAHLFYERESSEFMKPTLLQAAELNESKNVSVFSS